MAVKVQTNQVRRRLIIGSNVILTGLVVWAIIVLINFIAGRVSPMPVDTTRSGQFSISPRTVKLLENLKDDITLTALYRVDENEEQTRQQSRQVEDLLRRYQDITSKVHYQMLDPLKDTGAKTALLARLIKKYSGETEKHKTLVDEFRKIDPKVADLMNKERKIFEQLSRTDQKLFEDNQKMVAILYFFTKYDNEAKVPMQEINNMISGSDIPAYSDAVAMIQKYYETLKANLQAAGDYLAGDGLKTEGLAEGTKQVFMSSPQRYKEVLDAMGQQLSQMTNLPKLELEQIYNQVKQKNARTIIVEAQSSPRVKVLGFDEVWRMGQPTPGSEKIQYEFNGEAALSSAILALTAKEKSAVIFVHSGPPSPIKSGYNMMRMTQPPYSAVKEKLEQANFIVDEWDIQASPEPPVISEAKRRIFVITSSVPRRQQPGAPPVGGYTKEHVDKIEKLIDGGERMMFLVNFSPDMLAPPYPFAELMEKKFAVKPDAGKLVLRGLKFRDQVFPNSKIDIARYENFEITKPIQSLNTAFELSIPLLVQDKLPENVKVSPLVSIRPEMGDYWAESNIIQLMQKRTAVKDEGDLSPPFYLGVAVENAKTKSKAVIFGNEIFAADVMVNDMQTILTAQGLASIYVNPGNVELFTNSAFWLNDNENMIAVGPRGTDVPRIADISDNGQLAWKIFLWVIWPLCALITGGIVYIIRQK
ncbi:MAG: Gldg family protein [Phycisphaerae bacterium]